MKHSHAAKNTNASGYTQIIKARTVTPRFTAPSISARMGQAASHPLVWGAGIASVLASAANNGDSSLAGPLSPLQRSILIHAPEQSANLAKYFNHQGSHPTAASAVLFTSLAAWGTAFPIGAALATAAVTAFAKAEPTVLGHLIEHARRAHFGDRGHTVLAALWVVKRWDKVRDTIDAVLISGCLLLGAVLECAAAGSKSAPAQEQTATATKTHPHSPTARGLLSLSDSPAPPVPEASEAAATRAVTLPEDPCNVRHVYRWASFDGAPASEIPAKMATTYQGTPFASQLAAMTCHPFNTTATTLGGDTIFVPWVVCGNADVNKLSCPTLPEARANATNSLAPLHPYPNRWSAAFRAQGPATGGDPCAITTVVARHPGNAADSDYYWAYQNTWWPSSCGQEAPEVPTTVPPGGDTGTGTSGGGNDGSHSHSTGVANPSPSDNPATSPKAILGYIVGGGLACLGGTGIVTRLLAKRACRRAGRAALRRAARGHTGTGTAEDPERGRARATRHSAGDSDDSTSSSSSD